MLNAELYDRPDAAGRLRGLLADGDTFLPFDAPNMFFGGVHLAERCADGATSGAGDPRRSGVALRHE